MLSSFHIDQPLFGFENFHIEGLGRFNLIVGQNGVGKSALLEAIRLNHQGAQMICATDPRNYPYMPWEPVAKAYPQDFMFQRIVLIDEIENGLHHTIYGDIWRKLYGLCLEYDVQIIATTHSLEMIRAAHHAMEKSSTTYGLALFRIERQAYLTHRVVQYDHSELAEALEKGEELR